MKPITVLPVAPRLVSRFLSSLPWHHCRKLFFIGLLWPVTAWPALKTGPYLLLPTTETLRVCFEVDRPRDHQVMVPPAEGKPASFPVRYLRSREDTFLAYVDVPASRLPGGASYEIMEAGISTGRFTMSSDWGALGSRAPRLIVFGDSQGGPKVLRQLAKNWSREPHDLMVCVGDAVDYGSTYQDWKTEFFEPMREVLPGCPILMAAGNHDAYRERSLYWHDFWFNQLSGQRYGAIRQGPVSLFWLNDADLHSLYGFDPIAPFSAQLRWLQSSLWGPAHADALGLVFCHVPVMSHSTLAGDYGSAALRDLALPAIVNGPVAAVIAGHHHKYERIHPTHFGRPIEFVTTGGGGGRLFTPDNQGGPYHPEVEVFGRYHYLQLDWRDGGYQAVVHALEGDVLDRFRLERPTAAPASGLTERTSSTAEVWSRWNRGKTRASTAPVPFDGPLFAKSEHLLIGLKAFQEAAKPEGSFTLIGIDRTNQQWGYLQGARFPVRLADGWRFVETGTVELYPERFLVPIADWNYAQRRSGVNATGGILAAVAGLAPVDDQGRLHSPELYLQWGKGKSLIEAIQAGGLAPDRAPRVLEGPLPDASAALGSFLHTYLAEDVTVVADTSGRERVMLFRLPKIDLGAVVFLDANGAPYGTCFVPLSELQQFSVSATSPVISIQRRGQAKPWRIPLVP